jgi:hypothetical protein
VTAAFAGCLPNGAQDLFLFDATTGTNTLVSRSMLGASITANAQSNYVGMSNNGQYILFSSTASDIVIGDDNGLSDLFRFNTVDGSIVLVNQGRNGETSNRNATGSVVLDNGTVVFVSSSSNIAGRDENNTNDIFVYQSALKKVDLVAGPAQILQFDLQFTAATISGALRIDWGNGELEQRTLINQQPTLSLLKNFAPGDRTVQITGTINGENFEPPPVCRRPFGLSYAAMAGWSSMA